MKNLLTWLPKINKSNEVFYNAEADGTMSFEEFINGGNEKIRETIDNLRNCKYHTYEYNKIKNTLPMVMIGGYSESKRARKADITEIYNIISIDIDKQDNEELFEKCGIDILKDELSRLPFVYYSGLSCGGYGIVVYILTNNLTLENEGNVFNYLADTFKRTNIIIDKQTSNLITRKRFISYDKNAIIKNIEEVEPLDCDKFNSDDVDIVSNSNKTKVITNNFYIDGKNNSKIKIDRNTNVTISNNEIISGNDLRWRINIIAEQYFGNNAKEWCDNHFYYENGKSIYAKVTNSHRQINTYVLNWLISNNFLSTKNEGIEIKEGEYLTNKINTITEFTNKYDRSLIIAPTGTGKTTLINGVDGLADYYDAVVITPYNNTNELYNRCTLISSKQKSEFKHKDGKTIGKYVMNVDQAVKYWYEIKHKTIIIDECHTLFSERMFRDKMIQICNLINFDFYGKLILVTATPTGESEILNTYNFIQFYQHRNNINILFKYATSTNIKGETKDSKKSFVNPICWTIKNHYKKNIFDKIVLMDDISAKDVYDALVLKYNIPAEDILYYRADTKDNEDCLQMIKEEKLMKKITICTRIAFNGLNFKNENENVLVITSFTPGSLLASNIIQMVGRVRKSDVTCLCYYNNAEFKESVIDLEDKLIIKQEQEKYALVEYLYTVNEKYSDREWVEIVKSIDEYMFNHAISINMLTEELTKTNYITCKIYDKKIESFKTNNYRKQAEKQTIKKYIRDTKNNWNTMITTEDFNEYTYIPEWIDKYKLLISRYYENENVINNLLLERLAMTNASFENILDDIKLYCNICSISSKEYEDLLMAYSKIINAVEINIKNKEYVEKLNKKINKIRSIREKISEAFGLNEVLYSELYEAEQANENKQKKSVEGGKISSPKKQCTITNKMKDSALKKYNLTIGQLFESAQALCNYVNKTPKSISQWRSKGWIE